MASPDPYGQGEVIFGGYNENATSNGITWHDVITFEPVPGHIIDWLWALPASGLSVISPASEFKFLIFLSVRGVLITSIYWPFFFSS
jgi:hypothetical protein